MDIEVFKFLRKIGCRTAFWDGTEILCFRRQWPDLQESYMIWSKKQGEQVDALNEQLLEAFGDSQRWFHV